MKEKFYNTEYEEQETVINIDYSEKEISLYTSKKIVYERIYKRLGNPTKKYYTRNKISGAVWIIPFENKKSIRAILSRPILIGSMK